MTITNFLRHVFRLDRRDEEAHKIKNQMTIDILRVQHEVKQINDTAYKIAKATGRTN